MTFFVLAIIFWLIAWYLNVKLSAYRASRLPKILAPVLFGMSILFIWEGAIESFNISPVILPSPSSVFIKFTISVPILWEDLVQTAFKGALTGFIIGCSSAFLVALVVDRFKFLERGLLPISNFMAALPIVGTAPILVTWFGFDWHSKAAVVTTMVFFPMLANTIQGLQMSDRIHKDLMRTYNASNLQVLLKLRLSAAMPFVFNGLKICSTLALIGAIVAEFFGSPIKGMGFRISTEVGRFALDMVWAEITMAAIIGSLFYGGIALIEKVITFWHPSQRGRA
ncbi:MAG: ABC transporter permease [Pseudomonadota bacterium]|nr:ABC transporter permease [Pseudomonadota bacterium]